MKWTVIAFALLLLACAGSDAEHEPPHDHAAGSLTWLNTERTGATTIENGQSFAQLGFWLEGNKAPQLEVRVRRRGEWQEWTPVEITWSEEDRHVGRLFVEGTAVQVRNFAFMEAVGVELMPTRRGSEDLLTRDLPFAEQSELALPNAVAPRSLVIPRSEWGARNPAKICNGIVQPYRISVHHTASPSNDGPDPAARMRQMQAYHIDSNGWCDIGYHFVVSQSGLIYQGRSDERRPGAHVLNQNSGNVGISLIGNYSNASPPSAQVESLIEMLRWVSDTYDIPLDRTNVKGHREWPGQSTSCPGNQLLGELDEIVSRAANPEPTTVDVDVWVETKDVEDLLTQGTSLDRGDVLPGESFETSIYVKNNSGGPLRDVELGYSIEEPYLAAVDYVIESDVSGGGEFGVNDADGHEGNPPKSALGPEGSLTMYAFAAGETKRVRFTVAGVMPSIGREGVDHPDVRGWIRSIRDVYAQDGFRDEPTLNRSDERLVAYAEFDVLGTSRWLFDAEEPEMLEGWTTCEGDDVAAYLDPEHGTAVVETGVDGWCFDSPPWTAIDAGAYGRAVLAIESTSGPRDVALQWTSGPEDTFDTSRMVVFEVDGSGDVEVELDRHPEWTGSVGRLRLTRAPDEPVTEDVLLVDSIAFAPGTRRDDASEDTSAESSRSTTNEGDDLAYAPEHIATNDGCSSASSGRPIPGGGILLFGLLLLGRARRARNSQV
jgi:hypothetical protein